MHNSLTLKRQGYLLTNKYIHYICADKINAMIKTNLFLLLFVLLAGTSCNRQQHFISDDTFRAEVENDFRAKQAALPDGNLFSVFNQKMTSDEKEALTFLYAYMPIGDITDYDGQLYLDNIRSSFRARVEMPWGDSIPEDIFRHFVLPVRVNNENLDESRMIFYEELKDRVKGLSLYDAVLEVNHWCHEKVIYTPSDARTSPPLASVKTAYGRCGEESTFTVAALRSVGIPARQVYTPRWAHTDDNHAWVEAWVNGKWYFLGACEPEPVLNLGWFNGPAYRGMLMHTKVFGKYNGPEEVMDVTDGYTEINVIDNYAPTAKATITIVDENGQPAAGADVEFKIYNYAEFYSVANKKADAEGKAFLSAGKGDMLVWATKDGKFGYSKVSFGKDNNVTITLDKKPGDIETVTLDVIPPVDGSIAACVTDEQKEANAKRLHEEDVIRNKYVGTFYTEEKAEALAKELGIDPLKTADFMIGSRGNWREIEKFLRDAPADKRPMAMDLLNVISAKDLRDTPASVLADHLNNAQAVQSSLFTEYILNPRVANEFLTPYRKFFAANVDSALVKKAKADPQLIVDWVKENISINDSLNPQRIPIMPMGVWKSRVADKGSRDIFFVAVCRSIGIPARIEPVAGKVQYAKGLNWVVELQKNSLMDQIAEIERQEEDSLSQAKELETMSKDILELQFQKSEIERMANSALIAQRQKIQERIDSVDKKLRSATNDCSMAELDIQRLELAIQRKKKEKVDLITEYNSVGEATYPEYQPIPALTENDLNCPTCGQELPEDMRAHNQTLWLEREEKNRSQYELAKANFEESKAKKLVDIVEEGNR